MPDYCIGSVPPPYGLSIFTAITSIIMGLLIVVGNGLIFLAVYKDPFKRLRTPFSYFLVNLAISDFILGIVTMPLSAHYHLEEVIPSHDFPDTRAIHLSFFITSTASVLSMGALCYDRYMAVAVRLHHRKKLSRVRCWSISVGIWVISIASIGLYFITGYIEMLLILIHTIFIITLGMMVLTYRKVYRVLTSLAKELGSHKGTSKWTSKEMRKTRAANKEKNVTQTFLLLLLLFVLFYFPVIVFSYALHFCQDCSCVVRHTLRDLLLILICVNSAINPFTCILRLRVYRKSVWVLIRCSTKESYDMDCSQTSADSSTPIQEKKTMPWSKRTSKVHNSPDAPQPNARNRLTVATKAEVGKGPETLSLRSVDDLQRTSDTAI